MKKTEKKSVNKTKVVRKTTETFIELDLELRVSDEDLKYSIDTGSGFFNHMMELFARHSGVLLNIKAKGDTYIDDHHTVEDVGIALGKAFYDAAGDKKGINRYASLLLPMDEALVEVALDFGGRAYLHFDVPFLSSKTGDFDLQLVEEFFRAFAMNARITLHITLKYGRNDHHIAEAVFKGVARALREALKITSNTVQSTKGVLE